MNSQKVLYLRYQYISNELNKQAYNKQMKGKTRKLKQFIPCNKALIFTHSMGLNPIPVSSIVIHSASLELCNCHNHMNKEDLYNLYLESVKKIPGDSSG